MSRGRPWSSLTAVLRRDRVGATANLATGGFPGRWLGVISLLVSPVLLLVGELAKAPYHYYFPEQLQAYAQHPAQMTTGYVVWTVGWLTMWPAFLTLATSICRTRPVLGRTIGSLALVGLLVNLFYEGVNHLAFRLVDVHGVALASNVVDETYGWISVAGALTWTDDLSWIVLGIGCYLTRTVGWFRGLCIVAMAGHASGVLKGFTPEGVLFDLLLCFAFITLGVSLARHRSGSEPTHGT